MAGVEGMTPCVAAGKALGWLSGSLGSSQGRYAGVEWIAIYDYVGA